jgi:hypothetical protein
MSDRRRSVTRRGSILTLAGLAAAAGCATQRPYPAVVPGAQNQLQFQTQIAIDRQGNEVLAGSFAGQRRFAGGALTSAGSTDIFVAKTSPNGAAVFPPLQIGGPGDDVATGLAIDDDGSIVVGGTFQGEISFGTQKLRAGVRFPDQHAVFVARVDPAGKIEWLKQVAVANLPVHVTVAVRPDHNIVIGVSGFGAVANRQGPKELRGESIMLDLLSAKGEMATPQAGGLKAELAASPFGCAHSPCSQGGALVSGCGDYGCTATICAQGNDPYCCNNAWDGICVSEMPWYCGHRCDCSQVGQTGQPFYPDASPCVIAIGNEVASCVDSNWTSLCVALTAWPANHAACTPLCQ